MRLDFPHEVSDYMSVLCVVKRMPELSLRERLSWLRLARTPTIGPVTFFQLLAHCGSAEAAVDAAPKLAKRGGGTLSVAPLAAAEREYHALEKLGGRLIAACEPDYPHGLAALDAPPPLISALGHAVLLRKEMVAMVGARNASALGRKLAHGMARDLGSAGLVVVSGLARGIDAAAHAGALTSGTCAVVAGGVDDIYPPENAELYEAIKSQGVIVSEMPLGQKPQGRHFPRRNRIISGLARGVVVVEAAEKSGSLITARFALDQNREIFAVPGSPLDPRARGANRLIREGATLTESVDDVLNVLKPILGVEFQDPSAASPRLAPQPQPPLSEADANALRREIAESLSPAPVTIDDLVRLTGAPAGAVLTALLELELAGRLVRHPGGMVSSL